jgi:metal-responsive CopG/Arc/MetJ family transcriptional regulator
LSVICIRIPKELKEEMDKLRGVVNWSEEIRRFIEKKIEEIEQERALKEFEEIIKTIPKLPPEEVIKLVREDRDSY